MKLIFIIALQLLCTGCAFLKPSTEVTVESYARPEAATLIRYTYTPTSDKNDLARDEYLHMLDRALNQAGFIKAAVPSIADITLNVEYGMGDAEISHTTYQDPIYGQTGVEVHRKVVPTRHGQGFIEKTTYEPIYDVVGYQERVTTEVNYSSHVTISAVKLTTHEQLWNILIASKNSNNDLRLIFPYLVCAGRPYYGRSSIVRQTVRIQNDDPAIEDIRSAGIFFQP